MEDITEEDGNYVEYQIYPSMKWYPCMYEKSVVENLLKTQFHDYIERVKASDCQAELRRLLKYGPPVYISDKHAMPIPDAKSESSETNEEGNGNKISEAEEEEQYICSLWYASDPEKEFSSKLHGAVVGDDRINLWTELKKFLVEDGDDGDGEEEHEEEENV